MDLRGDPLSSRDEPRGLLPKGGISLTVHTSVGESDTYVRFVDDLLATFNTVTDGTHTHDILLKLAFRPY
jgi:hypothetical protein